MELITLIVALLVYIAKIYLEHRNRSLLANAERIQGLIEDGLSIAKSLHATDKEKKSYATGYILKSCDANKKLKKAFENAGIDRTKETIEHLIESGLHAHKLGIQNMIRDRIR
jgi:hypothetical protein